MDFVLFLLVNATLFLRPSEIVEGLEAVPIYNILIVLNLVTASGKILHDILGGRLKTEPISVGVVGLIAAIILSHVSHLHFLHAREGAIEFGKLVLYYLLLIAVVDTPARFRAFLVSLVGFTVVLTALSLLQYHEYINIPALDSYLEGDIDQETGESIKILRLRSTGIFHDPNDLSLILLVGAGTAAYLSQGGLRPHWFAPIALFGYALTLTHSRGGFLALLASSMILLHARFGARRAATLGMLVLPALVLMFAGRQTRISTDNGTGQDRIQIWAAGFAQFRKAPVFGIGYNEYGDQVGIVAHNSYIHALTELGVFGGVLFTGSFLYAISTAVSLGRFAPEIHDDGLRRYRPYLAATVTAYAFGMLTLSRNSVPPTYLVLGLATIYFRLVAADAPCLASPGAPLAPLDRRLAWRFSWISLGALGIANLFIKLFLARG